MIELTPDQVHALATPDAGPLRVVNPQTQEMYVLVPLAEYGRLVEDEYDDGPWTDDERALLRAEACEMLDSFGKKS
jgi:alpha-D-ribose 1-methylphosphonate 5-phosphate C-P lyase